MMQLETQIMERFVEIIQSDEALINPLFNRHQVYRDMVFHRFFETLKNIYPILYKQLGEEEFRSVVKEFVAHGTASVLLSGMAQEFGVFLQKHQKYTKMAYLQDLVWLEWSEAELLMQTYNDKKSSFDWKSSYKLCDSVRLRVLHYRVYAGDFTTKGLFALLLYYDFETQSVFFQEITPFAYTFATLLQTTPLQEAIVLIASEYKLDQDDLKKPLRALLQEWSKKMIITKDTTCVF